MSIPDRLFTFVGGHSGSWRVTKMDTLLGEPLSPITHLSLISGEDSSSLTGVQWTLRGMTSNERYVTVDEKKELLEKQQGLGRSNSHGGALIPIRKSPAWWALSQSERRQIFEEQSNHIKIGMTALPAVARRLHHCRDLSPSEPFDFLTWFEFAPSETAIFDEMVAQLRASTEWNYVEREIDIRLIRDPI